MSGVLRPAAARRWPHRSLFSGAALVASQPFSAARRGAGGAHPVLHRAWRRTGIGKILRQEFFDGDYGDGDYALGYGSGAIRCYTLGYDGDYALGGCAICCQSTLLVLTRHCHYALSYGAAPRLQCRVYG